MTQLVKAGGRLKTGTASFRVNALLAESFRSIEDNKESSIELCGWKLTDLREERINL